MTTPKARFAGLALIASLCAGFTLGLQERLTWAMVRATLTRALLISGAVALCIALISSAIAQTPGGKTSAAASGVYTLLSKNDPSIHIGDGEGAIADLEVRSTLFSPPDRHAWTFELGKVPDRIIFTVTIFSLTKQWDCPTMAWLNGTRVYDLRRGENVGSGKTTIAQFSVGKRQLKPGTNTIAIREEECTDTASFALNDSLIREVTYVFGSVPAAKKP